MHNALQNTLRAVSLARLLPCALIAGAGVADLSLPNPASAVPSGPASWFPSSIITTAPMLVLTGDMENPRFDAADQLGNADPGEEDENDERYGGNENEYPGYSDDEEDSEGYQSTENIRLYNATASLPTDPRSVLRWFNSVVARNCYEPSRCSSEDPNPKNHTDEHKHDETAFNDHMMGGAAYNATISRHVAEFILKPADPEMLRRFELLVDDTQQIMAYANSQDECGDDMFPKFFMDNNCFNTLIDAVRSEMSPWELIPHKKKTEELRNALEIFALNQRSMTVAEHNAFKKLVLTRAFYELYTLTKVFTERILRQPLGLTFPQFYLACYGYLSSTGDEYLRDFAFHMLKNALRPNLAHQFAIFLAKSTSHVPEYHTVPFDAEPLADVLAKKPPIASLIVLRQIIEEHVRESYQTARDTVCPLPDDDEARRNFLGTLSLLEVGLMTLNTATGLMLPVVFYYINTLRRKLHNKRLIEDVRKHKQQLQDKEEREKLVS
ncbi:hypothetical protein PAPHI01_1953, partial [Pancytospora philotis]